MTVFKKYQKFFVTGLVILFSIGIVAAQDLPDLPDDPEIPPAPIDALIYLAMGLGAYLGLRKRK